MITEIISKLGFNINDTSIYLTREQFKNNISNVRECQLFNDIERSHELFKFDRRYIYRFSSIKTTKQFMGFINIVLSDYPLTLKGGRQFNKLINGKWETESINHYKLYFC